jgi:hypothetical protein
MARPTATATRTGALVEMPAPGPGEVVLFSTAGTPAGVYLDDGLVLTLVGADEGLALRLDPLEAILLARRLLRRAAAVSHLGATPPAGEA